MPRKTNAEHRRAYRARNKAKMKAAREEVDALRRQLVLLGANREAEPVGEPVRAEIPVSLRRAARQRAARVAREEHARRLCAWLLAEAERLREELASAEGLLAEFLHQNV